MTLNELLQEIEDIGEENTRSNVDIYITPPVENDLTDEDSGDEECSDPDRLNRNLLETEALVGDEVSSDDDEESSKAEEGQIPPQKKLKSVKPVKEVREWVYGDLKKNGADFSPFLSPLTLSQANHPVDFFTLLFPEELVTYITMETVKYASRNNRQITVSNSDMHCFIAILYLSGYNPLPRKRMYWEEREDVQNLMISKNMRRAKFEEIFRNIHFADNDNLKKGDKMAKVRPLINKMNELFLKHAPIEQAHSIDESMIPYFGRHGCKQFIRGKPIRFGYKAWVMAHKLGYCVQFDIYQGRNSAGTQSNLGLGLGESVVLSFANILKTNYPDFKFSFYVDNFFTSTKLIQQLSDMDFYCTGTVRKNRTDKCLLPTVESYKKEKRGKYDSAVDNRNEIVGVRWKDNNIVTLLSNRYGVQPLQKAKRYSAKEKRKIEVDQPHLISMYNKNMGGVDQLDRNISNYRIAMRGKKWYMPIFLWMLDVLMNNAWILSRSYGLSYDNLTFRREVVVALLQKYGSAPLRNAPTSKYYTSGPLRNSGAADHIILVDQPRRRCAFCKNKTIKACGKCNVPLHDKCFADFHNK